MVLPSRVVRITCHGSGTWAAARRCSTKSGPISSPKWPFAARYSTDVRSGVPGRIISGGQTIYFPKSFIGREEPLVIVNHAEPKRHIVHCGVEPLVLRALQFAESAFAVADDNGLMPHRLVRAP